MNADPKWGEMADALIRIWASMGWQALTGLAVFALVWKVLDAWSKKVTMPKGPKDL